VKRDDIVPAAEAGKGRYPPGVLAGIDAALQVDAARRPRTVAAWRRILPPESDPLEPRRGERRLRRWLGAAVAGLLALGVAAGGYVWWRDAQEAQAWSQATAGGTETAYGDYLAAWPSGRHVAQARQAIADLKTEEEAWGRATAINTASSFRAYLEKYPSGRHAAEARGKIAGLQPSPGAPVSPAGGSHRVMLSSQSSEDAANVALERLQKAYSDVLGGLQWQIERTDLGDKGIVYRVTAGALNEAQARDMCRRLQERSVSCFVLAPR
jgi:hypothetical protein